MEDLIPKKALVIFSGGQDSTTCLRWATNRYKSVQAITFRYGQKHEVELSCSKKICKILGVEQQIVDISFFGEFVNSALTSNGDVSKDHPDKEGLPASFVPNRNSLFLTIAHSFAQKIRASVLVIGACQMDYSGFPDCRKDFIYQIQEILNYGSQSNIEIQTPLMALSKAETFALADKENCLPLILEETHTCYNGNREIRHNWGYGCGSCPACLLRTRGYLGYIEDVRKWKAGKHL